MELSKEEEEIIIIHRVNSEIDKTELEAKSMIIHVTKEWANHISINEIAPRSEYLEFCKWIDLSNVVEPKFLPHKKLIFIKIHKINECIDELAGKLSGLIVFT
jgi:hypothetical protein